MDLSRSIIYSQLAAYGAVNENNDKILGSKNFTSKNNSYFIKSSFLRN